MKGNLVFPLLKWIFRIGFTLHLLVVGQIIFNSYFYPAQHNSALLVKGNLRIYKDGNINRIISQSFVPNSVVTINQMPSSNSLMRFNTYSEIPITAWLVSLLDTLYYLCWLAFTFVAMQIVSSFSKNKVFERSNLQRVRLLAILVGLAPLIKLLGHISYYRLIMLYTHVEVMKIGFYYDYSIFFGLFSMSLILILVEVFNRGIYLRNENDLTI